MLFKCHGYTVAFRRTYKNIPNHIFTKSMLDFTILNFPAYFRVCEKGGESEAGRKEHYKAKKSWLGR
jgi:hypothetical protein